MTTPGDHMTAPQPQPQPQRAPWPSTARGAGLAGLVVAVAVGLGLMLVASIVDHETDLDVPENLPVLLLLGATVALGPVLGTALVRRVRTPLPHAVRTYGFQLVVLVLTLVGAAVGAAVLSVVGFVLVTLASLVDEDLGWAVFGIPAVVGLGLLVGVPFLYLWVHRRAERRAARREIEGWNDDSRARSGGGG